MNDDNQDEPEEKGKGDPGDQRNKRKFNELSLEEQVKRLTAENAELKAKDAELTLEIKVRKGTYFHTIDDVFPIVENQELNSTCLKDYKDVCRERQIERSFRGREGSSDDYAITFEAATISDNGVAATDDTTTRTSADASKENDIWPTNLFGGSPQRTQIVHLVPASVDNANTYWFVTDFLFGCKERTWEERQRLIHGVKTDRRIPHTGIKHSVANKFLLAGQGEDFDRNPNVLIIPILDVDQAKDWVNEGYEAIILIDTTGAMSLEDVAGPSQFSSVPDNLDAITDYLDGITASEDDIIKAHELVKAYTKAIVYAQTNLAPDEVAGTLKEKNIVDKLGTAYEMKLSPDVASRKVRKIQFAGHAGATGHQAPDPILLVTRAANQLQRRRNVSLVATPQEEEDEDDRDELSVLAEEMFLENRRFLRERELMGIDIVFQPTEQ